MNKIQNIKKINQAIQKQISELKKIILQKDQELEEIRNISMKSQKEELNNLIKNNTKNLEQLKSNEDDKIFEICQKLKDNEASYFIKKKNSQAFDSFLPDLTGYLLQIEKEKSVRKKILNLKAIFECMNNLSIFNGGENFDLDKQVQLF